MKNLTKKHINLEPGQLAVVVSDVHISPLFSKNRARELLKIFEKADIIIINGDFWDEFCCTLEWFLDSAWSVLFPVMRSKKTYYLSGNHDSLSDLDDRLLDFCEWYGKEIKLKTKKQTYHIEHGDKFIHYFDQKHPTLTNLSDRLKKITGYINTAKNIVGVRSFGRRWLKRNGNDDNHVMFEKARKMISNDEFLVFGHSHCPVLNFDESTANTGSFLGGMGWWLEITNEDISLRSVNY